MIQHRRDFLATLAAGLIGVWTGGCFFRKELPPSSAAEALERILDKEKFLSPELIALGTEYRTQVPEESDPQTIINLLIPNDRWSPNLPPDVLAEEVRERIEADFRKGDIVQLKYWYLCRTEARICALASLWRKPNS